MQEDLHPRVVEVLERIRARLRHHTTHALSRGDMGLKPSGPRAGDVTVLSQLLTVLQSASSQVGLVNPRRPGLFNDLIQLVKRAMRRMLAWYFRPVVEYQHLTTQFLREVTGVLDQQRTQITGLEERIEMLTAELAEMRQQRQSKSDWMLHELEKSGREKI